MDHGQEVSGGCSVCLSVKRRALTDLLPQVSEEVSDAELHGGDWDGGPLLYVHTSPSLLLPPGPIFHNLWLL